MNYPIDISGVTLHTERLTLRPWTLDDAEDMYEYASVDGVGQMAGWKPHESIEESRTIAQLFIDEKKTFAVDLGGKVIGSLGIEEYSEKEYPDFSDLKCREIGYVLSKDYWGRGLMPEAVREVIRYLFEDIGLDVICCGNFSWNRQSARVQEKCGFRNYRTGTYTTRTGKVEEAVYNYLTRDEWLAMRDGSDG